jgi:porin
MPRVRISTRPPRLRTPVFALLLASGVALGIVSKSTLADGLFEQDTLTDDWGGARKNLQDQGIQLGLSDIAETLSNPVGGAKQGTIYEGLVTAFLELDLTKSLKFRIDGFQINGRGLTQNYVGNLLAVSGIEALPTTRLHDLWLQQTFLNGHASLRVGQIAWDDDKEFYYSQYASLFINSTFGYPDLFAENLPDGGPGYPFAVPGARLRIAPTKELMISTAVVNGIPAPPGPGNPQTRNVNGTNFLIREGGTLTITELVYTFQQGAGDVKLGGWYHSANFPDLHFDATRVSLANPSSNGLAALHQGNYGPYLILDTKLWGLGGFLRVGGAPEDRNLINLEIDTGLTHQGSLGDKSYQAGVGLGYVRIGGAARGFAADTSLFTGVAEPALDYEAVIEATYQVNIAPWWYLQPDLQVILHPGGHHAEPPPSPTGQPIPNALVFGVRSAITF